LVSVTAPQLRVALVLDGGGEVGGGGGEVGGGGGEVGGGGGEVLGAVTLRVTGIDVLSPSSRVTVTVAV